MGTQSARKKAHDCFVTLASNFLHSLIINKSLTHLARVAAIYAKFIFEGLSGPCTYVEGWENFVESDRKHMECEEHLV